MLGAPVTKPPATRLATFSTATPAWETSVAFFSRRQPPGVFQCWLQLPSGAVRRLYLTQAQRISLDDRALAALIRKAVA